MYRYLYTAIPCSHTRFQCHSNHVPVCIPSQYTPFECQASRLLANNATHQFMSFIPHVGFNIPEAFPYPGITGQN